MEEKVQTDDKETVAKRSKNIPKSLLITLKQVYLKGSGSIREIAELYNVSPKALSAHCFRGKWIKDSERIVDKVVEIVAKRENSRLERLHSHEEFMIQRMQKRLISVDKSFEQVGDLVEPQDLKSLVSTESTIDQVIRRSLGATESKVEVSGSVEVNIVGLLQRLRADYKPERVIEVSDEALLEMGKNLTE